MKMVKMKVFYFGPDDARMGVATPFLIGVCPQGCAYAAFDNIPEVMKPGQPVTALMSRNLNFEQIFLERLLNGRPIASFVDSDFVEFGMGNWGFCIGDYQLSVSESV